MSYIELSKITANPETIIAPSLVRLEFSLSADKGTPVIIYYQLNTDNNIYFQLSNGSLVKEIVKQITMPAATKPFADSVLLKKIDVSPAQDHAYCFIYVQAVNKLNELSDIKHCMVNL
ncbi:hypothetical protein LNQ49_03950 [Flavobacterium sp. F-65]|uniref:Uncharacterized protein n=1 Tax=Flavobacterium pisciphilum TaxID=2893755 RepID=A0ABS8MPQ7_9FLAO|nr:hypothetical protein [Flavobacterium sp. F-65]MCC9070754.1 hypothetical protein [Flavobacterium sp. F-65]